MMVSQGRTEDEYKHNHFCQDVHDNVAVSFPNCFGLPSEIKAYMMGDMYKKNTCLDFPRGGNEALVGALVRGVEKHGGAPTRDDRAWEAPKA